MTTGVEQLSDHELKMEFRDLWIAGWNAHFAMPPRSLTTEAQARLKQIQAEMNRRSDHVAR